MRQLACLAVLIACAACQNIAASDGAAAQGTAIKGQLVAVEPFAPGAHLAGISTILSVIELSAFLADADATPLTQAEADTSACPHEACPFATLRADLSGVTSSLLALPYVPLPGLSGYFKAYTAVATMAQTSAAIAGKTDLVSTTVYRTSNMGIERLATAVGIDPENLGKRGIFLGIARDPTSHEPVAGVVASAADANVVIAYPAQNFAGLPLQETSSNGIFIMLPTSYRSVNTTITLHKGDVSVGPMLAGSHENRMLIMPIDLASPGGPL